MSAAPILVTGAGGFIGGRIVEILHAAGKGPVRAGVRRWSTAAQVGRLPVEIVACDVADAASLAKAMEGVRAVVHCAVGSPEVNAIGTRNVLAAAQAAGVSRTVHLSTIDVYGRGDGTYTEDTPRKREGAVYGDSKILAEEAVEEFRARGLNVAVLRPTIVYGPGSASWTVEFAERLLAGSWLLSEDDTSGLCNLVYVDDVAAAVLRALETTEPCNETFNVNGAEVITWAEYFAKLNAALGMPPLPKVSRGRSHLAASAMAPVRASAKWVLKKAPGLVMGVYQRSALARRLMKGAESVIKQTPTAGEFHLYSIHAKFPIEKAARLIGYRPAFSVADGIALSVAWLRHVGIEKRRA
jgi:nucleoside-diphosphate-sugar epimerase